MYNFYPHTSYPPYNTRTTMERNRPRLKPTPTKPNKQFYALIFFIASFMFASWYGSYDRHMSQCLKIKGNNFNICEQLF